MSAMTKDRGCTSNRSATRGLGRRARWPPATACAMWYRTLELVVIDDRILEQAPEDVKARPLPDSLLRVGQVLFEQSRGLPGEGGRHRGARELAQEPVVDVVEGVALLRLGEALRVPVAKAQDAQLGEVAQDLDESAPLGIGSGGEAGNRRLLG